MQCTGAMAFLDVVECSHFYSCRERELAVYSLYIWLHGLLHIQLVHWLPWYLMAITLPLYNLVLYIIIQISLPFESGG